jgi:hypothetical protein
MFIAAKFRSRGIADQAKEHGLQGVIIAEHLNPPPWSELRILWWDLPGHIR